MGINLPGFHHTFFITSTRRDSWELYSMPANIGRCNCIQQRACGATQEALAAARNTATNPAVLDAFALAIIATAGPPVFPGVPGHAPDLDKARKDAAAISGAMNELRRVAPDGGSYLSESNFFQQSWQLAFWGTNYPRLQAVKAKYDPARLFFVHHGVGSEGWTDDGFTRLA